MAREILLPHETKIIILALVQLIEDMDGASKNTDFNFTPDARKDMKEMLSAAYSAKKKLEVIVNKGVAFQLDPYVEGDEKEFLTKES